MTIRFRPYLAVILAAALAGCTLMPKYERPAAPVDAAYPTGPAYSAEPAAPARSDSRAVADIGWRDFFTDPLLQELIAESLANNRDLRIAALNVQAAQAQYRIQRSDLLPSVGVGGTGTVQRTPADLSQTGKARVGRAYQVGASVPEWELDFFGRIRSLNEQALQTYLSLDETRVAAQLSLVSEIANAYLTFRSDQELLALTEETLVSQRKSYDLTHQSYEGGIGTSLNLAQAEVSVRTAERNYALYTRQVAVDRNALVLLLGQPLSPDLASRLDRANRLDDNALIIDLPAGLPSDLLTRRPDVRSAEHALEAANANIGAARAAFFPRITLTGDAGTASSSLGGLFNSGSGAWSFTPTISIPIFAGGSLKASLDLSKVNKNIQVATYEKAIQGAFRDVANALASRGTLDAQIQSQKLLVAANQRAYDTSNQLFRAGVSDYLAVLDSQRSLYDAQQTLIQTRLARLSNLVTLYSSLGGGWTDKSVSAGATNAVVSK